MSFAKRRLGFTISKYILQLSFCNLSARKIIRAEFLVLHQNMKKQVRLVNRRMFKNSTSCRSISN